MEKNVFHLGLCMAGSISAGAYTAGVIDYLHEALENWQDEKDKNNLSVPDHDVVIDLLGGASGGGITAALAFFGLRNHVPHASLEPNGKDYRIDEERNVYWKTWVEMTQTDILNELLSEDDIREGFIPSILNAGFIDEVAETFKYYIQNNQPKPTIPGFLNARAELFLTLFNITGFKYKLRSKSPSTTEQFVSEHRDIAHFRWTDEYKGDGRMEISFRNQENLKPLLDSAKATGAFPVGLKARIVERKAKYIWDNPFFRKNGKFDKDSINLGSNVSNENDIYKSINGDGGTANNEPIELCKDLLLNIRINQYKDIQAEVDIDKTNDTEKTIQKKKLSDSSIILIDPFPSLDYDLKVPDDHSVHLLNYIPKFISALNSQLIFDAKDAFEAYDIDNYGLHIIAPSKDGVSKPDHAIACGSLNGFGGFFKKEFRIHDFFLGRHNCQSFLRKYFVVDLNESESSENYRCVQSVIRAYKDHSDRIAKFSYEDEQGRKLVPIIPDVTLKEPIKLEKIQNADGTKTIKYKNPDPLPLYKLDKLDENFFDNYRNLLKSRIRKILNSLIEGKWPVDVAIGAVSKILDDKIADKTLAYVIKDLKERNLIK